MRSIQVSPWAATAAITSDMEARKSVANDRRGIEFIDALNNGGMAIDFDICAHTLQLRDMHVAIFKPYFQ